MSPKMKSYLVEVDGTSVSLTEQDLRYGKFKTVIDDFGTDWTTLQVGQQCKGQFTRLFFIKDTLTITRDADVPIFHKVTGDGLPYDLQARLRELADNGTDDMAVLALKIIEIQELVNHGITIAAWEARDE